MFFHSSPHRLLDRGQVLTPQSQKAGTQPIVLAHILKARLYLTPRDYDQVTGKCPKWTGVGKPRLVGHCEPRHGGTKAQRNFVKDAQRRESESKLVAIDPFRALSELRALEPPNDEPESLDLSLRLGKLGSIVRHLRSQVTHQPVQRIDVRRQRGEINVHARNLRDSSNHSDDDHRCESISRRQTDLYRSAGDSRSPPALRRAPVDPINQH
jgi:hypothetical protein